MVTEERDAGGGGGAGPWLVEQPTANTAINAAKRLPIET